MIGGVFRLFGLTGCSGAFGMLCASARRRRYCFASNFISPIPTQNFSKRFFDMLIKVFKVANTRREIREYTEQNILYVLLPRNTKICNTWLGLGPTV